MTLSCAFCHSPASYHCGRCRVDSYCSKTCQRNDFLQHRFVCFNMPSLVAANGSQTPGLELTEDVQAMMDKLQLVVPDADKNEPVVKLKKIEAAKSVEPPKKEDPKPVAPIKTQEVSKPTGNAQVQKSTEIVKPIAKEAPKVPAANVELQKPKVANVEAPKPQAAAKIDPPLKTPAFNQGPRSAPPAEMNKQMKMPPAAEEQRPMFKPKFPEKKKPTENARFYYSEMKHRDLPNGEHRVSIMNGTPENKTFYVMETFDGIEEYVAWIEDSIKETVAQDKTTFYAPETDEMVLAKFDGDFYRGVVVEKKKDDTFSILFIDYGNISDCSPKDIKPFPKPVQMEIILHEVVIMNLPEPLTKKATQLLGEPTGITIDVKKKTDIGSYTCDIVGL